MSFDKLETLSSYSKFHTDIFHIMLNFETPIKLASCMLKLSIFHYKTVTSLLMMLLSIFHWWSARSIMKKYCWCYETSKNWSQFILGQSKIVWKQLMVFQQILNTLPKNVFGNCFFSQLTLNITNSDVWVHLRISPPLPLTHFIIHPSAHLQIRPNMKISYQ